MLGPTDLLATWESGLTAGGTRRALLLHALARGRPAPHGEGVTVDDLLAVPVGRRDAALLGLRRALFGERLRARVACATCGAELELDVDTDDLARDGGVTADPVTVESRGWRVRIRQPTPADLLALGGAASRAALLARCVVAAERDERPVPPDTLPDEVAERAVAALAEADPCADIRLTVACVQCGGRVTSGLDVAGYLWAELDAWARATLLDVHLLATAYGWSEAEILAVSPTRRRYYLELVNG